MPAQRYVWCVECSEIATKDIFSPPLMLACDNTTCLQKSAGAGHNFKLLLEPKNEEIGVYLYTREELSSVRYTIRVATSEPASLNKSENLFSDTDINSFEPKTCWGWDSVFTTTDIKNSGKTVVITLLVSIVNFSVLA